jgi:hypothetical protein
MSLVSFPSDPSPRLWALSQIEAARSYTLELVASVPTEHWFTMPGGCPTHVAWQVGHLAMAEYGLCLFRQRGRLPDDLHLMPSSFRKLFSRQSQPSAAASDYPPPDEILATLHRVHAQVRLAVPQFAESDLRQPAEPPYAVEPTRLGSLLFCAHHEMLHGGQIGLLRRMLGYPPLH